MSSCCAGASINSVFSYFSLCNSGSNQTRRAQAGIFFLANAIFFVSGFTAGIIDGRIEKNDPTHYCKHGGIAGGISVLTGWIFEAIIFGIIRCCGQHENAAAQASYNTGGQNSCQKAATGSFKFTVKAVTVLGWILIRRVFQILVASTLDDKAQEEPITGRDVAIGVGVGAAAGLIECVYTAVVQPQCLATP